MTKKLPEDFDWCAFMTDIETACRAILVNELRRVESSAGITAYRVGATTLRIDVNTDHILEEKR